MAFAHEIYVALAAVVFFILTLAETGRGTPRRFALLLSAGAVLSALWAFGAHGDLFGATYRVDAFSQTFKVLISLGFFIVVALGDGLKSYETEHEAEYYLFLSISVLGLTLLTSAMNLLTLYIALEVASYALYILVPLRRGDGSPQVEAAIKYILFGAAASGVSLFGISYVFGLAHTTDIATLVKTYPAIMAEPMGLVALSMMFASFFFKLAIFPFHVWTPDVYEGAANETSAIIATLPKIGAVAVLIRLTGMAGMGSDFTTLLVVLAALSMTFGNFAALVQTDVKRLLAFSSISHAGYMMTGILTNTITGSASAIYYVGGYLLMNLAIFFVIYNISTDSENVTVDDLKGLHSRSPLLAFTLAVGAFGLAGIPPTAGFAGKLFVLTSAFKSQHMWLVIIGAANTAISIYYYLKMVRAAYAPDDAAESAPKVDLSMLGKALGVAFILAILLVGSLPGYFMDLFKHAL